MKITTSDTPRIVVASATEATTILRTLQRQGWRIREGFALPEATWDLSTAHLVLYGRVNDPDTAEVALLAAARAAGVVIITDPDSPTGQALLADLERIGPVNTDPDHTTGSPSRRQLAPEQQALLRRLANGDTIAAAAAAEFLSLRTANRRIADARQTLGVRTTREAVLAYIRQRHDE